jgi:hypothetical protein
MLSTQLTSTKATIRDPEKVRVILEAYAKRGAEIQIQKRSFGWALEMAFRDNTPDESEWPLALRRDELPSKDAPGADQALDDLYEKKGSDGFLALLRDLAAHLESPLLVLVVGSERGKGMAQAWSVMPGADEIDTLVGSLEE